MNIFEEVRNRAKITDVCNLLGIKLDRNYKSLCPFHKEKTASFSVSVSKNIFYCFGCNKKGDVTSLVSEVLKVTPLEAAKYINEKLCLGIETNGSHINKEQVNRYYQEKQAKERFNKWENETFQKLCEIYHVLCEWKKNKKRNKEQYIYALKNIEYLSYLIDEVFIYGTNEDKLWFKRNLGKKVDEWKKTILTENI